MKRIPDHPRREALLQLVVSQPGCSFRQLVHRSGMPAGTVRHHLTMLERAGLIWSRRVGCRLAHFNGPRPGDEADCIRSLARARDEIDTTLLRLATHGPVRGQDAFFEACTGTPRSTIQHRLARLVREGLLIRLDVGRWSSYRLPFTTPTNIAGEGSVAWYG